MRARPKPCRGQSRPASGWSRLARSDFYAATRIENGDDERFQFFLDAFCKRGIKNLAGDLEGKFSHLIIPYALADCSGLDLALSRLMASTRATWIASRAAPSLI